MTLFVGMSENAENGLVANYQWWAENRSAEQASRWFDGILEAIESIGDNPHRFAVARENKRFPFEIREMHFGLSSRPTHRVVFTIRPDMVLVVAVLHAAQDDLTVDDI